MVSLVLLGAGASFGSGSTDPYPPPLGNGKSGLFARLEQRGGIATRLPDTLKVSFNSNFEQGMAEYYEYADGNIMAFQREMAEYLAEFKPNDENLFLDLIRRVGILRVVYSTLNYDLLLELAAARLGINTIYSSTGPKTCARLLKLHGSSNFWPNIPVGVFRGLVAARNGKGDVAAPVRPLTREETLHRCKEDDSFAPAMAMYAEGKPVRVCPDYVSEQQTQWRATVDRARYIFISGVRVHLADTHIWDVLAHSSAPVVYFGLNADRQAFSEWEAKFDRRRAYFIEADFAGAIRHIASRIA